MLPCHHCKQIPIRGDDFSWEYEGRGATDGKQVREGPHADVARVPKHIRNIYILRIYFQWTNVVCSLLIFLRLAYGTAARANISCFFWGKRPVLSCCLLAFNYYCNFHCWRLLRELPIERSVFCCRWRPGVCRFAATVTSRLSLTRPTSACARFIFSTDAISQSHMASAAEELTQTHAASITRASTLLVDDDVNNVR